MSGEHTQIENKPGTVRAGDFVMSNTITPVRSDAVPNNVIRINVDMISAGKRMRKIDEANIDRLYQDIGQQGMLQPIGVRQSKDDPNYVVIYGLHRLLAFKRGWAKAQELIAERTDKDPEAYRMARMWQSIPCVVHDSEMPLDFATLKEIVENLVRTELTKDERAVHEVKYTHLVKKLGLVITADEKRAIKQTEIEAKKKTGVVQDAPDRSKPTATEKVTTDLGVSTDKLKRSHKQVNALAKAVAKNKKLAPPVKITVETEATPEAEHTIQLAELGAIEKIKAEAKGEDPRKVHPIQPAADDVVIVRVNVRDPKDLLEWFKGRLAEVKKPMTIDYLRKLHAGLGDLIEAQVKQELGR